MQEPQGLDARRAALDLIDGVTGGGRLLSELRLPPGLVPEARARAERLAADTLRWAQRADRVLGPHLRLKPRVRTHGALRLALWEMLGEGAPAHGVVNAAVALVREREETQGQAGLVNAILRKIAAAPPDWDALPVPELPKWLRKPLVASWGKTAVAAMEAAHAAGAPLDLTPARRAPLDLAGAIGAELLPTGSLRLAAPGQVSLLPGYEAGQWWVQDAAAALPARALGAKSGERVLDLCAAPGGKTLQLADAGAHVSALDISEARIARVSENLARCGFKAEIVVADALDWAPEAPFDAVLLDAPCSATGTIRRHPDLPHAKDASGLKDLAALQAKLIDRALEMLAPGGRLVFCTCSLLPEEGEGQVREALARHPALELDRDALALPGIEPEWIGAEGLRLRPDYWPVRGGIDGFFVAALRKPAGGAGSR